MCVISTQANPCFKVPVLGFKVEHRAAATDDRTHNHSLMASTDLLSYAICVSNRPPFSPHMSAPNKQMAYPAAAT